MPDISAELQLPSATEPAVAASAPAVVDRSIMQCFDQQAAEHADRPAVCAGSHALTYSELRSWANRQAHALRGHDVRLEEPVAILLEPGPAWVAALLGVMKAGGCCVPLDPGGPTGRNLQILQDSGARIVLTDAGHRDLAEALAGGCCEVLYVDSGLVGRSDDDPQMTINPESLACVLFTSASAGRPKGVMHDHLTLVHNANRYRDLLEIGAADRLALLDSCTTYEAIRDTCNALLSGASVHCFEIRKHGSDAFADWLSESEVTVCCSTPAFFRRWAGTGSHERLPNLRRILLAGGVTRSADVALFNAHLPPTCRLHCAMESSEAGLARQYIPGQRGTLEPDETGAAQQEGIPLGFGVPDLDVLLIDEAGRPVPAGEVGEIVIRSRYISRGYWQRPDLSAWVLVCEEKDPRVRSYRTGEAGALRTDGCLEHRRRNGDPVVPRRRGSLWSSLLETQSR